MELLEEVILSRTLNRLRGSEVLFDNATTTFIETKEYVQLSIHYSMLEQQSRNFNRPILL